MPISKERATRAVCDACGRVVWCMDFEDPEGVAITLAVVDSFGGRPVFAFSCEETPEHVGQAVVNALSQGRDSAGAAPLLLTPAVVLPLTDAPEPTEFDRLEADLLPAVSRRRRPPERTDEQLRTELLSLWTELGRCPSTDRVKKVLRIGDARAKRLLASVADPT